MFRKSYLSHHIYRGGQRSGLIEKKKRECTYHESGKRCAFSEVVVNGSIEWRIFFADGLFLWMGGVRRYLIRNHLEAIKSTPLVSERCLETELPRALGEDYLVTLELMGNCFDVMCHTERPDKGE